MVALGAEHGLPTCAVLTDMNRPLGAAVGNALEVAEALEVLEGGGPPDVVELTRGSGSRDARTRRHRRADPEQTLRDGIGDGPVPGTDRRAGRRLVRTVAGW